MNVEVVNPISRPVKVTGTFSPGGAASSATGQVALNSSTPTEILAANAARISAVIRNLDGSIDVYVGDGSVDSSSGFLLKAGESMPVTAVTAWSGISEIGRASCRE